MESDMQAILDIQHSVSDNADPSLAWETIVTQASKARVSDIHLMAQITQRPAEIFDINALPAAGRIPPVGQKAYI